MSNNIYVEYAMHCIGMDRRKPYKRHGKMFYRPYRNFYSAGKRDCEIWDVMVASGYAEAGEENQHEGRTYWMTRAGLDWLGEKLGIVIHNEEE